MAKKCTADWACFTCSADVSTLGIQTSAPKNSRSIQTATNTLPAADYLIVTWTEGETSAAAKVFGGGNFSFIGLNAACNNFIPLVLDAAVVPLPNADEVPASDPQCQAFYFPVTIGGKSAICLKSNLHPKRETAKGELGIPMQVFFKWLAKNNNFKYIITSGTSGGIWPSMDVGDVVVCNSAQYDPNDTALKVAGKPVTPFPSGVKDLVGKFAGAINPYQQIMAKLSTYAACPLGELAKVRQVANGAPQIYYQPLAAGEPNAVVTDINFDKEEANVQNGYIKYGAAFDNNDAFVAEALQQAGYANWVSVRNISDIPGDGSNGDYETYQDCSSVIGALAVYAFIAGH